jgi:glycosyltransferase involved in cell wall biosynthesis
MPFFSIVVPAFNRHELLEYTLESIMRQSFKDYEVLVVDDGSLTGDVKQVVDKASSINSRVNLLSQRENRGLPGARNVGLDACRGTYVIFLDSDDLMFEWTLQILRQVIEESGEPTMVVGSPVRLGPNESIIEGTHAKPEYRLFEDYYTFRTSERNWWFNASGAALRTEAVRSVLGFWAGRDPCEDLDLWQRLGTHPGFVRIDNPRTFGYRLHDGNMHKQYRSMGNAILRIIRREKGGDYPGGSFRRRQRISIIASHARHHALELAREHETAVAFAIYVAVLRWNFVLNRWIFLIFFPLVAILHKIPGHRNK